MADNVEYLQLITGSDARTGIGNALDNQVLGNEFDNTLEGLDGNDTLGGYAGNDTIFGEMGNDYIVGGDGDDILLGGDNTALLADGNDTIYGGAGNDQISGENGDDVIYGESGTDLILGAAGYDLIVGGTGNDTLQGGADSDVYGFFAGDGQDIIADSSGSADTIVFDSSTVVKDDIALFMDSDNNLFIDYGSTSSSDQIAILDQSTYTIEQVEIGSYYLTDSDISQLIQDITTYATNNGITLSSVEDVKANADLMTIVSNAWQT